MKTTKSNRDPDSSERGSIQHRMPLAMSVRADRTSQNAQLKLSSYQPALNRKDVKRKVLNALEHFLPYYASGRELRLSVGRLEQVFGKHQNPIYSWLKTNLLTVVRNHANFEGLRRDTTYKVNQQGFAKIWQRVHGVAFDYPQERARQVEGMFRPYIDGMELPLHQTVEGGRLYGLHQTLEKPVRAILLKHCYDYDIQAAMPTLVIQSVAEGMGLEWRQAFPAWAQYLGNRAAYRENLAERLNITKQQAKEVLQGMFDLRKFDGGRGGISLVIGVEKCKKAMDDPTLQRLRAEAITVWKALGLSGARDGTARFNYYEQVEQLVMNEIYDIATEHQIRFWPFHDGFTLLDGHRISDLTQFTKIVHERTNFWITLDENRL